MTHASLFSGIGGAEIAAEWVGWENLFHCEINPFGRKVLEYWYPNSISYEDITKTDFTEWRGRIDVLTAGFPCQPFSLAGQRKGADDDRYLWPQVVRVIRETRPAWVVGENVAGILTMVQPGEEVEVGSEASLFGEGDTKRVSLRQEFVIETVCRDLEREGYSVRPFVIPACAVGAPHRRDRVWIVARRTSSHPDEHRSTPRTACEGTERSRSSDLPQPEEWGNPSQRADGLYGLSRDAADPQCFGGREIHDEVQPQQSDGQVTHSDGDERHVTHTDNKLLSCRDPKGHEGRKDKRFILEPCGCQTMWRDFPTQSPVRMRYDGISNNVVRYIKQEVYDAIKEHIRREDLPRMWKAFQKKEVREKIGRLYEIPEPDLLLEILQRTSEEGRSRKEQGCLSSFSERTSERVLRYLRKHRTFASSPLGQKYKEQFSIQFENSLPELSHEIALATKKIVEESESTANWWRQESIKALGNAMCPQVVYEIFRAIQHEEEESEKL